ncbi:MAG: hypothetical protein R2771_03405 [Saprospiraceae bacterium]
MHQYFYHLAKTSKIAIKDIENTVNYIKSNYAPDHRTEIFDIEATEKYNSW